MDGWRYQGGYGSGGRGGSRHNWLCAPIVDTQAAPMPCRQTPTPHPTPTPPPAADLRQEGVADIVVGGAHSALQPHPHPRRLHLPQLRRCRTSCQSRQIKG